MTTLHIFDSGKVAVKMKFVDTWRRQRVAFWHGGTSKIVSSLRS